ncbi:MAG: CDP-alcohol phosphatidyltransferase family protein [Parcubacteria group bacterium]|nr:CDP-alcohol phosphatidyltransferase family protein [Parcubacteria group bacterium]
MLVNYLKKITDKLIPSSFFEVLLKLRLTPNRLTLLSVVAGIIAFYFFLKGEVILGGVFVVIDYILDGLDGRLARYLGKETKIGAFYDLVTDRGVCFSWLIAMAYGGVISFELALLVLFVEALSYILTYFVEYKNFKHIKWLPNAVYLLPYGALLNQLEIFFKVEIFLGGLVVIIHLVSVILMNQEKKLESSQSKADPSGEEIKNHE